MKIIISACFFCIFITIHFFNFSQETERGGVSALGSRIGRAYYKVDRSTVGSMIVNLLFICGVFALTARYLYILSFVPKPGVAKGLPIFLTADGVLVSLQFRKQRMRLEGP